MTYEYGDELNLDVPYCFKMNLLSNLLVFLSLSNNQPDIDPKLVYSIQRIYSRYAYAPYCDTSMRTKAWNCENLSLNEDFTCPVLFHAEVEPKFELGYLIFYNPERNFLGVSFRGSVSFKNLLTDLNMGLSPLKWGTRDKFRPPQKIPKEVKIHTGFHEAYIAIRKGLMERLSESCKEYNTSKLVFTGHSLGGALATITAVDFHDQYGFGDQITIASYGQPRVGNAAWAQYLESLPFSDRHYRTVAQGDPIVEMPPKELGYRHAGREILYTDDGQFKHILPTDGTQNIKKPPFQTLSIRKHGIYKEWIGTC